MRCLQCPSQSIADVANWGTQMGHGGARRLGFELAHWRDQGLQRWKGERSMMFPPELEEFIRSEGVPTGRERVVGCHLWPPRSIGSVNPDSAGRMCDIVHRFVANNVEVLLTRNGGLFTAVPEDLPQVGQDLDDDEALWAKIRFEEAAAAAFNPFIAELAMSGFASEAAAPVHIAVARRRSERVLINSAGGGRENYLERNLHALDDLLTGRWLMPR